MPRVSIEPIIYPDHRASSTFKGWSASRFIISDQLTEYFTLHCWYYPEKKELNCEFTLGEEHYDTTSSYDLMGWYKYEDVAPDWELILEEELEVYHGSAEGTVWIKGLKGNRNHKILKYIAATGKNKGWVEIKVDIDWDIDNHVATEMCFDRTRQGKEK